MTRVLLLALLAQELDTVTRPGARTVTVLDELEDPAERAAYLELYRETRPLERRSLATRFLNRFSRSRLLAQANEAAAQASFDMDDVGAGLFYARQSLRFYPENAPLLVRLAAAEWRRGEKKSATNHAADALDLLERFAAPAGVGAREWRTLRDELRKTAEAITGPRARPSLTVTGAVTGGFAGSRSCERCHTAEYAAWSATGMARMLRPLEARNVIGDFAPAEQPSGARLYRQGDGFFAEIARQKYRLDFTIGSKWQQAYATRTPSGDLHVLPLQYNALEKKWINYWRMIDPPGSPRADLAGFHRFTEATSYQRNCAPCHTSQVTERGFSEPGVGCEMCHGPSSSHAKGGPPVFRFAAADHRLKEAVCAQCHAQSSIREPLPFPPLYTRRPYAEYSRRAFYGDGRFRETTFIAEAFERSACFRRGQADCTHCHRVHAPDAAANPVSLAFRDDPDRLCLQCHPASFAARKHTKHEAKSEGARCVSCHMPKIMNSLLFRARSHQLDDKPDAALTARFGQTESPNACLICHTERSTEWLREQLRSW